MKCIFHYMKSYRFRIAWGISIKFLGTLAELLIPFLLEYMIDHIVPTKKLLMVLLFGGLMVVTAILVRNMNIIANRYAASIARDCIRDVRHDLFSTTVHLTGSQFDYITLPSLISRMTSDTYNVQNFIGMIQRMGVRAPIMLIGGIFVSSFLDPFLALVLLCMVPVMGGIIMFISIKGIPMYHAVQERVDHVTRILRENITGIRVVKALSREKYERERYEESNEALTDTDLRTGITMALPNPILSLFLNCGLVLVVIIGAHRVNKGVMAPGVILAFLTYFNMIMMAVMGINRIVIQYTKAGASANRIAQVLALGDQRPPVLPVTDEMLLPGHKADTTSDVLVRFQDVSFSYPHLHDTAEAEDRENSISDISFDLRRGETLGIIGSTGCGKTTLINLLMRFYDISEGQIFYNGRDVRTYTLQELREHMSVVFQNDTIFADTLAENIRFGRDISDEDVLQSTKDSNIADMILALPDRFEHMATKAGANLSGGEKQRILIARALAGKPELLILDDASSALDYKTDAALRKALREHYPDTTTITIAQRISSVMSMDHILVMESGEMLGYGTHEELMATCEVYRDIYQSQMGGSNATA